MVLEMAAPWSTSLRPSLALSVILRWGRSLSLDCELGFCYFEVGVALVNGCDHG